MMEQTTSEPELDHPSGRSPDPERALARSPAVPWLPQDVRLQALKQARYQARQAYFSLPTKTESGGTDPWLTRRKLNTALKTSDIALEVPKVKTDKGNAPEDFTSSPLSYQGEGPQTYSHPPLDPWPKQPTVPVAQPRGAVSQSRVLSPSKPVDLRNVTSEFSPHVHFSTSEEIPVCEEHIKAVESDVENIAFSCRGIRACRAEVDLLRRHICPSPKGQPSEADTSYTGCPEKAFEDLDSLEAVAQSESKLSKDANSKGLFKRLRRSLSNLRSKGKKYQQEKN